MKLSPNWLRDFVDLPVDYHRLADDLTLAGIAVEGVSGEGESTVFEMEITTNRPDAMNHYGVAREASALYDLPLKTIAPKLPNAQGKANFTVTIAEAELCPRFTARVIRNVSIKPSPANIAQRLALLDQRPINNAVDATNYTLWEMGKPTHVFDLDLLEGGRIIVRRAKDGETLKTLDGIERKLTSEDLVVADAVKPVGLAGTMGGYDTMITDKTRNILIESRMVGSRYRPQDVAPSRPAHRCLAPLRTWRGFRVHSSLLQSRSRIDPELWWRRTARRRDRRRGPPPRSGSHWPAAYEKCIAFSASRFRANEVVRILKRLGFDVLPEPGEETEFTVHIPSWRLDVEREIDLIEEIARLHGYDKFPNTLPAYVGSVIEQPDAREGRQAAFVAAGARIQRDHLVDVHLARGRRTIFVPADS